MSLEQKIADLEQRAIQLEAEVGAFKAAKRKP
jgi:hypothetical protein